MYLAMDELGCDNVEKVLRYQLSGDRWRAIDAIAQEYGVSGVQITPKMYEGELGLNVDDMPDYMLKYRLTCHYSGSYALVTVEDSERLQLALARAFILATRFGMEDVSLHPMIMTSQTDREAARQRFASILNEWLPRFTESGITLSLENHAHEQYWIFTDRQDYSRFIKQLPGLGSLIDVSHSFNDGLSVSEIMATTAGLNITGLHFSDAIKHRSLQAGTHLPIGKGHVDFSPFVNTYRNEDAVYAALEIKGMASDLQASIRHLKSM